MFFLYLVFLDAYLLDWTLTKWKRSYVRFYFAYAKNNHLLVRVRLEEIQYALTTKQLGLTTNRERSPSPEPVYDKDGKRVNTRDARAVEHYNKERQRLLEQALSVCPSFKVWSAFFYFLVKLRRVMLAIWNYRLNSVNVNTLH